MTKEEEQKTVIIKIGGSSFDLGPEVVKKLLHNLNEIIKQSKNTRFVLMPGGGPLGDVIKDQEDLIKLMDVIHHFLPLISKPFSKTEKILSPEEIGPNIPYGQYNLLRKGLDKEIVKEIYRTIYEKKKSTGTVSKKDVEEILQNVFEKSLAKHANFITEKIQNAQFIPREEITKEKINEIHNRGGVVVATHIPEKISEKLFGEVIPFSKSDAHTIAFSKLLDTPYLIYVKDTPGIFDMDPNINPNAKKLDSVTIGELRRISRKGEDGRGDHLIEDHALDLVIKHDIPMNLHVVHTNDYKSLKEAINHPEEVKKPIHNGSAAYHPA
jgi:uridylate kinase